jgi:hypothetical protein
MSSIKRLNGYLIYYKKMNAELKVKNPGKKEFTTEIVKAWYALPAKEREMYGIQAKTNNKGLTKTHRKVTGWQLFVRTNSPAMKADIARGVYQDWADAMKALGVRWKADEGTRNTYNDQASGSGSE